MEYEEEAIKNPEDPMWCRGIATGDKLNPPPCWIRLDQCIALMTPGFIKLVEKLGYVGTDGAGGKLSKAPKYRHVGAGAGVMIIGPDGVLIIEAIWSMVPGKQRSQDRKDGECTSTSELGTRGRRIPRT